MKVKRKLNMKRITILILILVLIIICIILFVRKFNYQKETNFVSEVFGVRVNTKLIESGTSARTGKKRKIKYIVIHETANTSEGADAKSHAEYLSKNSKTSTSWHYTVDEKEIYNHIPDNEVANHAANEKGNLYGIGIELCVNKNGDFEKTFENGAKLVAYLLKEYNLTTKSIKTHNDFSGKDCPHFILKDNRMDEFIKKVESLMK